MISQTIELTETISQSERGAYGHDRCVDCRVLQPVSPTERILHSISKNPGHDDNHSNVSNYLKKTYVAGVELALQLNIN